MHTIRSPKTARSGDEFEPERLPGAGAAPVCGDAIPNPSHPVASHIHPAEWRLVSPRREVEPRYCICGIVFPVVTPEKCSSCGRAVSPDRDRRIP